MTSVPAAAAVSGKTSRRGDTALPHAFPRGATDTGYSALSLPAIVSPSPPSPLSLRVPCDSAGDVAFTDDGDGGDDDDDDDREDEGAAAALAFRGNRSAGAMSASV